MAARLLSDPNLVHVPDFPVDFAAVIQTLVQAGNLTLEDATSAVRIPWEITQDRLKAQWQTQLEEDEIIAENNRLAAEEAERAQRERDSELEEQARALKAREAEDDHREKEKKRPSSTLSFGTNLHQPTPLLVPPPMQ